MPTVISQQGTQKFPYTQQGMAAAQQAAQSSGGQMQFDQDPFAAIVNAARRPSMVGGGMGGMMAGQPQGNMPGMQQMMGEETMPMGMQALQPGKTGDITKPLLGAISQLHGFIASATDPEDIQMVRQIVSILTNLIQRDQERSGQELADNMGAMGEMNGGGTNNG